MCCSPRNHQQDQLLCSWPSLVPNTLPDTGSLTPAYPHAPSCTCFSAATLWLAQYVLWHVRLRRLSWVSCMCRDSAVHLYPEAQRSASRVSSWQPCTNRSASDRQEKGSAGEWGSRSILPIQNNMETGSQAPPKHEPQKGKWLPSQLR